MTLFYSGFLSAIFSLGLTSRWRAPKPESPWLQSAPRRLLGLLALTLIFALTLFLPLLSFRNPPSADELLAMDAPALLVGHMAIALFLLFWWALVGFPSLGGFLCLRLEGWREHLRTGTVAGVIAWAVAILVMLVAQATAEQWAALVSSGPGAGADAFYDMPEIMRGIVDLPVCTRLAMLGAAMVTEELFFRSFLQPRCGLLVSSALFTLSHFSYGLPLMLVGVFAVSVVLGLLFRVTRNVLPCMVAHGVFDAVQLFVVLPLAAWST